MREPDVIGNVARAWRVPKPPDAPKDQDATVAAWLIEGPFHPAWQHWLMSVVHLREIPGVKPAVKRYPEAAYEFLIASLHADGGHDPTMPPGGVHASLGPMASRLTASGQIGQRGKGSLARRRLKEGKLSE